MRNRSPKQAALYRRWTPIRNQFLLEFPYCWLCGQRSECVHEITNGPFRMKGFVERATWCSTCARCNCDELTDKAVWSLEGQLALKLWHDAAHFNLDAIRNIYGDNRIDPEKILESLRYMRQENLRAA